MSTEFEFPANPAPGDTFTLPSGSEVQWNGYAWVGATTGTVTYPLDISLGGTSAATVPDAQTNLIIGLTSITDTVPITPKYGDRWIKPSNMVEMVWVPNDGTLGVWVNPVDSSGGGGGGGGSGIEDAPIDGKQYGRQDAAWTEVSTSGGGGDFLPLAGGTLTGDLTITSAITTINLNNTDSVSGSNNINGLTNDVPRWTLRLGGLGEETGGDVGSDFVLDRYSDAGVPLATALSISRANGDAIFGAGIGASYVNATQMSVNALGNALFKLNKGASGSANYLLGTQADLNRWVMILGDTEPESTGNVGSDFQLFRYDDAGVELGSALSISRSTGNTSLNGLAIANSNGGASITLNVVDDTKEAIVEFQRHGIAQWYIAAPTTVSAGGNFGIARCDPNTGVNIDVPLGISSVDGTVTVNYLTSTTSLNALETMSIGPITNPAWRVVKESTNIIRQYFDNSVTHQFSYDINTGIFSLATDGGAYVFNNDGDTAAKKVAGQWAAISDSRVKDNIQDYIPGLNAVLALQPRTFTFKAETGRDVGIRYTSLIAQEAETAMPDLVTTGYGKEGDIELNDMRTFDPTNIQYALINSVKELKSQLDAALARIAQLEGKAP
jgi:Chaperone of endosialidase